MMSEKALAHDAAAESEPPTSTPLNVNVRSVSTGTNTAAADTDRDTAYAAENTTTNAETPTTPTTPTATTHSNNNNSSPNFDVDDEELQRAMAMALAIQQNPRMSPEDIQKLLLLGSKPNGTGGVGATPTTTANTNTSASTTSWPVAGQRVATMFHTAMEQADQQAKELILAATSAGALAAPSLFANKWGAAAQESSNSTTAAAVLGGDRSASQSPNNNNNTTTTTTTLVRPLNGLVWKRRGGMGKYSQTAAWELRRMELVGSRLTYFKTVSTKEISSSMEKNVVVVEESAGDEESDDEEEGMVVATRKRTTSWLGSSSGTSTTSQAAATLTPRGYLDLAKEKATVCASFGHSGAPSPFALSIKVGADSKTKWKLCFDHHKTQMTWLAALSDVAIQTSVDLYNQSLLHAADPSAGPDFTAQQLHQPPQQQQQQQMLDSTKRSGANNNNRLWMMDAYAIQNTNSSKQQRAVFVSSDTTSQSGSPEDDEDDDETTLADRETTTTAHYKETDDLLLGASEKSRRSVKAADHNGEAEHLLDAENDVDLETSAETNFQRLALLVNVGLILSRASSVPIEGFWYFVVLTNVGLYVLLNKTKEHAAQYKNAVLSMKTSRSNATVKQEMDNRVGQSVGRKVAAVELKSITAPVLQVIPRAGTTTIKLQSPRDSPKDDKDQTFAGWCAPPGTVLQVRSHGYADTKAKTASPGELYECVNVDIFESPRRYPDMATRVKLPDCSFDDGPVKKTWRSPDIFVVSVALPTDPPAAFGKTSSDGGGYTITMYFKMHQETREILRRVTADDYDPSQEKVDDPQTNKVNAVRLFEEWCRRAPTDPKYQARFKVVPQAHNLKEIGMPSWISKYNGKPFLVKRAGVTGFLFSHPELSCMEFDVSLHPFPYLAKQAICFMKDNFFKKILVTFGFVIEGRGDDELPECVLGLMQLCYPDPTYAIQGADFFGGTAQKSF